MVASFRLLGLYRFKTLHSIIKQCFRILNTHGNAIDTRDSSTRTGRPYDLVVLSDPRTLVLSDPWIPDLHRLISRYAS